MRADTGSLDRPRAGARMPAGEILRKALHMGAGLGALLLPFLTRWQALAICVGAVAMNALVLPRLTGHAMDREEDRRRGWAAGVVLYPAAIGALILLFGSRMEVVAAAWAILAFGDGAATLAGRLAGGPRLPWNPRKSWAGLIAFVPAGGVAALLMVEWIAGHMGTSHLHRAFPFMLAACATAAILAAFVESYPSGIDDNLTVPILAGTFLFGMTFAGPEIPDEALAAIAGRAAPAIGVNALIAAAAWAARTVNVAGALSGLCVGAAIAAFGGWGAWGALIAFFVLGSGATKIGYARKQARRLAQESGGRRGARHAIANCGTAVFLAVLAATTPHRDLMLLGLAAALATAAFDTVSSELGQLWGRRAFLITTLRRVPAGTEGAVSLEGTLAGLAAAAGIALLALASGLTGAAGAGIVVIAALVGATAESYLGALAGSGAPPGQAGRIDNEAMNFINTFAGAAAALALAGILGG